MPRRPVQCMQSPGDRPFVMAVCGAGYTHALEAPAGGRVVCAGREVLCGRGLLVITRRGAGCLPCNSKA